jgi:WD40 repeat protein
MLLLKETKTAINCLAFSPDGGLLAAGTEHGVVQLWDAVKGTLAAKLSGCYFGVRGVFFIAGGVALLAVDNLVRSWPLPLRDNRGRIWAKIGSGIEMAALSPDGVRLCVYRRNTARSTVSCYTMPDCTSAWMCYGTSAGDATAMAFSPDGSTLLIGDYCGQVVFRNAATGKAKQKLSCDILESKAVALSPDGRTLAWAGAGHLRMWRLNPLTELVHHYLGRTHFLSLVFHPSGRFLASANGDGKIDFWDAQTGQHQQAYDWKVGKLNDVVFDATGDRAACCSKTGEIVIWDVDE